MDDLFNLEIKFSEPPKKLGQPDTRYYCPTYTPNPTAGCSEFCPTTIHVCTYPKKGPCMIASPKPK